MRVPHLCLLPANKNHSLPVAGILSFITVFSFVLFALPPVARAAENIPWSEIEETATSHSGLINFYQTDNALYVEVPSAILEQTLGMTAVHVNALGDGLIRGDALDNAAVRWRRVGNHLVLERLNLNFRAAPGSAYDHALQHTFPATPLFSAALHSDALNHQRLIANATTLFSPQLIPLLPQDLGYKIQDKSVLESLQSFSDNIVSRVHFTAEKTPDSKQSTSEGLGALSGFAVRRRAADARYLPLTVEFHFFRLPQNDFQPRPADERIGTMSFAYKNYDDIDHRDTAFQHLARRFYLRKQNPAATVSDVVEPITFYLDHSLPQQWRPLIREATLWWNKAFEQAGLRNAIRVADAPDDPAWNAADINHSVIFWNVSDDLIFSGLAGPFHINPLTGQVLKSNVYLNAEFFSFALNRYLVYAWWRAPEPGFSAAWLQQRRTLHHARSNSLLCDRAASFSSQIAFARLVLQARGILQPGTAESERFAREAFKELVAHEVGHALGFPHNWKASLVSSWEDVRDGKTSGRLNHNLFSSSVMDYDPIYFAPKGEAQGDYFMQELGAYDYLAVDYLYRPLDGLNTGQQQSTLDSIAARAETEYGLVYDNGLLNAIDPTVNADDLGDDPLAFAEQRLTILQEEVFPRVAELVLAEGHDYNLIRQALDAAIFSVALDYIDMTARHIGGQELLKLKANITLNNGNNENGPAPITPLPSTRQRQALQVLDERLFASDAFQVSPQLLALLKADMLHDWNYPWRHASDYNIGHRIAGLYEAAFSVLLEPQRLTRVLDNERRLNGEDNPFTLAELFTHLRNSTFTNPAANAEQRALQRIFTQQLIGVYTNEKKTIPAEARQLAALNLQRIQQQSSQWHKRADDDYRIAHYRDLARQIQEALHPRQ